MKMQEADTERNVFALFFMLLKLDEFQKFNLEFYYCYQSGSFKHYFNSNLWCFFRFELQRILKTEKQGKTKLQNKYRSKLFLFIANFGACVFYDFHGLT